jgi:hypothetical protein
MNGGTSIFSQLQDTLGDLKKAAHSTEAGDLRGLRRLQ